MMPSTGQILCAPFTDETLYNEQVAKAQYWTQGAFYGIDLTPLAEKATEEYFGQVSAGRTQAVHRPYTDRTQAVYSPQPPGGSTAGSQQHTSPPPLSQSLSRSPSATHIHAH